MRTNEDARLFRCAQCGSWGIHPRNIQDLSNIQPMCSQCCALAIDTVARLTAMQGGAPSEAQTAARSARWDTNNARYTQPVDN